MSDVYLDTNHYQVSQLVNTLQSNADEARYFQLIYYTSAKFHVDGNLYCYSIGEIGSKNSIFGYGNSPYEAMVELYKVFHEGIK